MSRPQNSHRRQRLSPAKYQPEVQRLASERLKSNVDEVMIVNMEEAAVAVHGLMQASGPKVRERIRRALVSASMNHELDVRDDLMRRTYKVDNVQFSYEY